MLWCKREYEAVILKDKKMTNILFWLIGCYIQTHKSSLDIIECLGAQGSVLSLFPFLMKNY